MVTCNECNEWAMLHLVLMPPHKKRFCAPSCPPPSGIWSNMLRSDQCGSSARHCTPCVECSLCIALSWWQHVAGCQSSAKEIAIGVVLVSVCFWLSTFGRSFPQGTSKKPAMDFARPTDARSGGLCIAFHGLSTVRY